MDSSDELDHFSLKWNNYNDTMKTGFHDLLQREDFVDVTIAVEGKLIQAHKMVLSICSPYFKTIFKTNPCQHPVVFLRDVTHREISGILRFMYLGEVSITQEDLAGFLRTAEALQIKGLCSEDAEEASPPGGNNAREDEETKYKDEKKIKILPSYGGNNDRNSTKISPLCNGDNDIQIETIRLSSHDSHNGDDEDNDNDDNNDEEEYDDVEEEEEEEEEEGEEEGEEEEEEEEEEEYDDDDDEDVMDNYDHGGGEPKKMKMSPPEDGLSPIDPHVPVIRTPERPVINSNPQPSQAVMKDVRPQTDSNAFDCERASVVQEIDGNDDNNQGSDDREDFAEEIINSSGTGDGSEMAQEVNNFQPVADSHTQGKSDQGTAFPTMLKKNQGLCPICGRVLQHKKNLQTHILDQHTGIFGYWPCQICHRVCRTWSALRVHTNRHHLNLPPAAVQMSIIGIAQESN